MPERYDRYDRVAVVTGSDSGIGEAIAVALAGRGFDVGVTYRSDKAGAETTAEKVRGEIATPMTGNEDVDPFTVDRPGIPVGRPGDANEVAAVVAMLATPAAGYVTGASWVVDGGMLMMGPQAGSHLPSDEWRNG